jgi:hypothetical protein
MPGARMLWIVTMKLIAPRIDEIDVRWIARIQRSWPVARLEGELRERRIRVPARRARPARREPARVEDDPAEQEEPVRERVQARKAMSRAPIISGHEEVAEAGEDRHDDEEDHRRPVHGEHLVVGLRVKMCSFGLASCERISSAMIPPATKKSRLVRMYRIPIRLWSTVASQLE